MPKYYMQITTPVGVFVSCELQESFDDINDLCKGIAEGRRSYVAITSEKVVGVTNKHFFSEAILNASVITIIQKDD